MRIRLQNVIDKIDWIKNIKEKGSCSYTTPVKLEHFAERSLKAELLLKMPVTCHS